VQSTKSLSSQFYYGCSKGCNLPFIDLRDVVLCCSQELQFILKLLNFLFTSIFLFEAIVKITAFGVMRYIKDR